MKDKNTEVAIYVLRERDAAAIKKIEIELNLSPWSLEDYKNEAKRNDSISFVAYENGKLIGFLIARLIMYENYNHLNSSELEIFNLGVAPDYQQTGIASRLLQKLFSEFKPCNTLKVWLEVRESNQKAINFYKSKGFIVKQIRKNFYTNPVENAFVMNLTCPAK